MGKPVPIWQLYDDLYDSLRDRSAMDRLRNMVARRACIRDTHRLDDAEVIELARRWLTEKDSFVSKRSHPEGLHAEKHEPENRRRGAEDSAAQEREGL